MSGEERGPSTPIALLGPQRFNPTVGEVVRWLAPDGPVVTVTAGWREREPADVELEDLLDRRAVNLGLFWRRLEVFESDPELAEADARRRQALNEHFDVYRVRLHHGLEAVYELQRRSERSAAAADALAEAVAAVQDLDRWHVERIAAIRAELHARAAPATRPAVARHRDEVARLLSEAAAVAIAGGHVDVLLACLDLFGVGDHVGGRPIVAWSAGAMALTERVVLFADRAPQGAGHAEVLGPGLGLIRGVVVLPHARRRLRLGNRSRMTVFARRFAPAPLVVLDDGQRVDCRGGDCSLAGVPVINADGALVTREAA